MNDRRGDGRKVIAVSERESMPYDVVIVGAGPAGLSAAIRLKQLANEAGSELSVCVLEKGSEVGAHILSGAVIDPKSLDELIPDWRTQGCPLAEVPVNDNQHWVLTKNKKFGVPHFITPGFMHNKGTYTGSLGNLCRWLAEQAEGLGVEIFPGFAAAEILYNEDGSVKGVATGDMGIARDGSHKPDYAPGLELHAKYTFFAEGVRGHLTKMLKPQFALDAECEPQVYGIGIKELWDIKPENHAQGRVSSLGHVPDVVRGSLAGDLLDDADRGVGHARRHGDCLPDAPEDGLGRGDFREVHRDVVHRPGDHLEVLLGARRRDEDYRLPGDARHVEGSHRVARGEGLRLRDWGDRLRVEAGVDQPWARPGERPRVAVVDCLAGALPGRAQHSS